MGVQGKMIRGKFLKNFCMLKVRFIGPWRPGYCQDKVAFSLLVNINMKAALSFLRYVTLCVSQVLMDYEL